MSESTGYWEVVENYEAEREEFLSVRAGQVVEVLDDSRSSWMVLTVPMVIEELQEEGFLPAHLLRPAGMYIHARFHTGFVEGGGVHSARKIFKPHTLCQTKSSFSTFSTVI